MEDRQKNTRRIGRKNKEERQEIQGGYAGNTRRIVRKYKEDRQEIQGG